MSATPSRKRGLPTWATILAWLGIIGTILGVITGVISLVQFAQQTINPQQSQENVYATLAALQVASDRQGIQLTQFALAGQQAANQSTADAINAQAAVVQGTLGALQAQQDAVVATQHANAELDAATQAAAAVATQNYLDAGATSAALSQIPPTATDLPTPTPVPAAVADYRSLTASSAGPSGDGRVLFSVQAAQDIPAQPPTGLAYVWLVDTDRNPSTGQPVQDIGVDMRVTVRYDNGAWLGSVQAILVDGTEGVPSVFTTIDVVGSSLAATVSPELFGQQGGFDWIARSQSDQETYPLLPGSGHFSAQ